MRLLRAAIVAFAVLSLGVTASASTGSTPTIVMPDSVHWAQQPGNFQMAVLYGDPTKPGFYVLRLKLPANWAFPVHHHPQQENVTVLSGTLYAAVGSKFNKSAATAFPAGSFVAMPANVKHFAFTKAPAIIQIDGTGPSQNVMEKM